MYRGEDENAAFKAAKDALLSDTLLIHYDPEKKLILTCDASPDRVGAVLSRPEPFTTDKQ